MPNMRQNSSDVEGENCSRNSIEEYVNACIYMMADFIIV